MSVKVRLVAWEVRPVIVADDGEHLTEVPIPEPARIAAREWSAFKDGGDEQAIDRLREQVEAADQDNV